MNRLAPSFVLLVLAITAISCGRSNSQNTSGQVEFSSPEDKTADEIATFLARRMKSEQAREMKGGIVQNTMIAETIVADTIEVQQIDVVDSKGLPRLRLLGDHENPLIGPTIAMLSKNGQQTLCYISENAAGTGLTIQDRKGTNVLQIIATKDGPVFGINDSFGKNRLMLFASEEGGSINFISRDGRTLTIDEKKLDGR